VLETLKRQGAGKALLGQVAESGVEFGRALLQGGSEQITEANTALKTIADLASQTGKGLSEAFFGKSIDKLQRELERVNNKLDRLAEIEKEGHSHDIVMDGEKVASTVERGINRNLDRRRSACGGAVRK
jgi:hypothetical protein